MFFGGPILFTAIAVLTHADSLYLYLLAFTSGFFAFAAVASMLIPPKRIEDLRTGADGEVATAKELAKLARGGWRPVHDRALDKANIDHIVIGPGGVYAIDSKNWKGTIKVSNGEVVVDGNVRSRVPGSCRSTAAKINSRVSGSTGNGAWVQGVVVFWGDFPQRVVESNKVVYVAGDALAEWLHARPPKLSGIEIDEIAHVISEMRPGIELSLAS